MRLMSPKRRMHQSRLPLGLRRRPGIAATWCKSPSLRLRRSGTSLPHVILRKQSTRRDGRVVEGARLESVYRGNSIEGSNPSLSAIFNPTSYREPPLVFGQFRVMRVAIETLLWPGTASARDDVRA